MDYCANQHVGQMIIDRIYDIHMSRASLAQALGLHPANLQRILKKPSMDTGKLAEISRVLGYNFFKEFCISKEYIDKYLKDEEFFINDVNIGKRIEARMKEKGMTQKEMAEKLNIVQRYVGIRQQRVSIILSRETIDTNLLFNICAILDYNFFEDYYKKDDQETDRQADGEEVIPWEYTKKVQFLLLENVDFKRKINILRKIVRKAGITEDDLRNMSITENEIREAGINAEDYELSLKTALSFWEPEH